MNSEIYNTIYLLKVAFYTILTLIFVVTLDYARDEIEGESDEPNREI